MVAHLLPMIRDDKTCLFIHSLPRMNTITMSCFATEYNTLLSGLSGSSNAQNQRNQDVISALRHDMHVASWSDATNTASTMLDPMLLVAHM